MSTALYWPRVFNNPHSLRLRLILVIAVFIICITGLLQFYTLGQLEKVSRLNIEHEGLLLSDTLEASILPNLLNGDVEAIQDHINRLVENRETNDIEINILALRDAGSVIIASNVPDNIEPADEEEHVELLAALNGQKANMLIELESDDFDPDDIDDDELELGEDHPDNYFQENTRYLSVTTPLIDNGHWLGGINVKLSLSPLDSNLEKIQLFLLLVIATATCAVILGLGYILNQQIFYPLKRLRLDMGHVANGDLARQLAASNRKDEIGLLAASFNSMADQLEKTRRRLHQYLNPMAIKEAYRHAGENREMPCVEDRKLSVLFVDIVAFTTTAEKLDPQQTAAYLNQFFDLISVSLVECGGYIDKFVADEAICVFERDNHADDVVRAARKILQLLAGRDDIRVRIGVNSGNCIVADIGSQLIGRLDRTIIGDTVNTAQRLMTGASPNTAVLSLSTMKNLSHTQDDIIAGRLQRLKGKAFPVQTFELRVEQQRLYYVTRPQSVLEFALAG